MKGMKGLTQLRSGSDKYQPASQNGTGTSPRRGPPSMHDSQMSMPVSSAENSIQVSVIQFPCLHWVASISVSTQLCSTARASAVEGCLVDFKQALSSSQAKTLTLSHQGSRHYRELYCDCYGP